MIEHYKATYMNPGTCYYREVQFNNPEGFSPVSVRFTAEDVTVLGDYGCWVFKGNIRKPLLFFSGDHTNPGYWEEKLEAAPGEHYDRNVDEDALRQALLDSADEFGIKEADLACLASSRDTAESWYDTVDDLRTQCGWDMCDEDVSNVVNNSRKPDTRYLIVCEFVQRAANIIMDHEPKDLSNG